MKDADKQTTPAQRCTAARKRLRDRPHWRQLRDLLDAEGVEIVDARQKKHLVLFLAKGELQFTASVQVAPSIPEYSIRATMQDVRRTLAAGMAPNRAGARP